MILYDAAGEKENRPFPKRIIFTAWFDSGKQGKEWPGTFDIVEHAKPRQWKFAQSVKGEDGKSVLKLSMRGVRELEQATELTLLLRSSAATPIGVAFALDGKVSPNPLAIQVNKQDEWQTVQLKFTLPGGARADEIRFTAPEGTAFAIDDLLLYSQ
jgi:hypothetical protein